VPSGTELDYTVVVNAEEQYSIWPAHRTAPEGWLDAGCTGSREHCLAHIGQVWTDITPLSVRRALQEAAQRPD
jgi:MbtH protein